MGKTLKALTDGVLNLLVALPEVLDNRAQLVIVRRNNANLRTALEGSREEARAAWDALDTASGMVVWQGAVNEVTDPAMCEALARQGVDGRRAVRLSVTHPIS